MSIEKNASKTASNVPHQGVWMSWCNHAVCVFGRGGRVSNQKTASKTCALTTTLWHGCLLCMHGCGRGHACGRGRGCACLHL